ncbi:glycosyl transferase family protein [Pseudohalioglobus lutimaris]|uniref:Glycosyl transferase family protein n=1 Tax=Pseudohalioglobus lutimaris TaxID=1737061 RepID=A0A2N5WWW7_9GAMM|nr:glycosyl transferase family protein [Pseudohalioglobus lutimaris]PLW66713.1 glycosyl transferase family protein [Pseudohalioglobus lutimaris]
MNITPVFDQPATEHPFAPYVRILGKGKSGSRSFDRQEAATAFSMILANEVEPLQLGAFLMLLRVKEETGEELAGFVDACRLHMKQPGTGLTADLDWSSYAGKKHQHPWYVLSLLLLAGAGYRVFVHGSDGHTAGRLYTAQAMTQLGLPVAADWQQVSVQLDEQCLSYLPLRAFCPRLHELIQLRPLLGLRSPVNTLTRMLNPLSAPASLQSVFHPAYAALHQEADRLLGQPRALVLKGDSGEIEVKPQADTRLQLLRENRSEEILLPRTLNGKVAPVDAPDTAPLVTLWRGEQHDAYGLNAVLATTAAALLVLQPEWELPECEEQSRLLWADRDPGRLN